MMRIRIGLVLTLGLWMMLSAQTSAQDMATPGEDAKVQVSQDENGALFLSYKGASLISVLDSLAEVSKINFVAGNEIAKREVNMTLDGVTLDQALQAISNGSNVTYAYMPDSNIIMFRASSDAPQLAPLFTRVFKLYFLRASKIQKIDAGQSSSGGSGSSSGSGSSGGLSGGGGSGSSSGADGGEVPILKIMEKMLSERGSVAVDDRSNSLIVTDSEDRLARVASVVAELDRPLNQVLINVLLVETFEDLDREFGIEWGNKFGTLTGATGKSTKFPYNLGDSIPFMSGKEGDSIFNNILNNDADITTTDTVSPGSLTFGTTTATAKALQTASKLKILAKPNILVLDNQPAIIKIATNARIGTNTTSTGSSGATDNVTESAERAEVGTILRVTPQINSQDQVTMVIEPTFATVDESSLTASGETTGDPTVRAARTTVMVNSGKTLVMGGLLFSEQSDATTKTPFLGDLPFVGRLFTYDHKSIEDRELVLFITPQIIKNPAAMNPSYVPSREERFDDVNAEFWKYKKKTWYKNVKAGGPPASTDFDSFFKVRETAMDETALTLQTNKDSAMKSEVQTVGNVQNISDGVKWDVH